MITEEVAHSIREHLFSEEAEYVYAVLDGASVPDLIPKLFGFQPEYECLYRGELAPDMAEVAPYLVQLDPDSEFTVWLIEQGWGQHWGIFARGDANLREMRRHFRSFLTVSGPDGKSLIFRYYDPRVLRMYLPTCTSEELETIFGSIASFMLEDENPDTLVIFDQASGSLKQERLPLK